MPLVYRLARSPIRTAGSGMETGGRIGRMLGAVCTIWDTLEIQRSQPEISGPGDPFSRRRRRLNKFDWNSGCWVTSKYSGRLVVGYGRSRERSPMSKQSRKTSNGDRVESVGISSELTVKSLPPAALNERDIASLAYQRWLERGCPQGSPEEDWLAAEHELRSRDRSS